MKKSILLSLLFTFFSFILLAQEEPLQPKMQIGLTGLPIVYINNGQFSVNGLAVYGNIGWWIKEKQVVGLRPFIGYVETDFEQMLSIGNNLYYRYYFNKSSFSWFTDLNLGFGYIWYEDKFEFGTPRDLNGIMFNYAFGLGFDWAIAKPWNLEFLLQYLQMRNLNYPNATIVGNALIPSIGIQRYF